MERVERRELAPRRGLLRPGVSVGWPTTLCALALVAVSLGLIWVARGRGWQLNDDTYITLTYAKSLAAGDGWRYNGGPVTLGSTAPLFALLVAGLSRLVSSVDISGVAVGLSVLFWLGAGWLPFLDPRPFGVGRRGGALVAMLLLLPGGLLLRALGMEATMLLFGLVLTIWLVGRGHAAASALTATSLALVRPEGLAMLPLAALWLLWRHPSRRGDTVARLVLGAAIPALLWAAYALPTFGSVLPNSVIAKIGQGRYWPGDPFATRLVRDWLPPYFVRYGPAIPLSLLLWLPLIGLIDAIRGRRAILLFAGWVAAYAIAYTIGRAPGYWWYQLPVVIGLLLFSALGIEALLGARRREVRALGLLLALLFAVTSVGTTRKAIRADLADPRAPTYHALADWLRARSAPRSRVAATEIGYLGFFTDNRVVDLVGLVEPRYTAAGSRLELAENFWEADPDYLVYHPAHDWLLGDIVRDPRFSVYREVARVPSHLGGETIIFGR